VKIPRGSAAVKWSPFKNVTELIGKAEWVMMLSQKTCLLLYQWNLREIEVVLCPWLIHKRL